MVKGPKMLRRWVNNTMEGGFTHQKINLDPLQAMPLYPEFGVTLSSNIDKQQKPVSIPLSLRCH
jgi:hypothetical protein